MYYIYRGPGFLAFLSDLAPSPSGPLLSHQQVVSLSPFSCVSPSSLRLRDRPVLYNPLTTLFGYGSRLIQYNY